VASVRERIVEAAMTALEQSASPNPAVVHRYRTRPIERDQLPAIVLYPTVPPGRGQSELVQRLDHDDGLERTLNLRAECRAEVAEGEIADAVVDPLYLWVVTALRADPTLGGLAVDLQERAVSYDAAESGRIFAACAVDFEVTYYTAEDDPAEEAS